MTTRPMRVALMIGSLREGGAEGQFLELARGLRARGHAVRLYLLHYRGMRLSTALAEGFDVVDVGLPSVRPLWEPLGKLRAARAMWRTVRDLQRFRPDVLHPWMFEADAWMWAATKLGVRGALVTTRRIVGDWHYRSSWRVRLQSAINRSTAAVIVNARAVGVATLRREAALSRRRVALVYNGMRVERVAAAEPADLRAEFPTLASCAVVGICVANLLPYKGHADLLRAVAMLGSRAAGLGLLLVGSDEGEGPRLRALARELGLADRVCFAGSRTDVPRLLRGSDLFLFPSHQEGFSNALMEAMAAGLPIVATRIAGNPEMIDDGRTGLLVDAGEPARFAEALARLLDGRDAARTFGDAAHEAATKRFSVDAMVESTLRVYRRALRTARAAR